MTSQLKHIKHYEAELITNNVIMKNNGKVRDVRSLACKIKVLNGRVPGTWKWTIALLVFHFHDYGSNTLRSHLVKDILIMKVQLNSLNVAKGMHV